MFGLIMMKYFKKIVNTNLYLSPININDVEKFTEWINDLNLAIYLSVAPDVVTIGKEREILEKLSKEGYHFSIVKLSNDELIGICGLLKVDQVNKTAEVGIFIGNKRYWGKGYGTEAINLLLDYSFNLLNLNSIFLRVHSFNKRAITCYKKSGFKEIGIRREAYIIGGKKYDQVYMDIIAKEFEGKIPKMINENSP